MRGMDDNPYKQQDLLSAEDVARYFGVGHMTVYRWCKQGRLRCIKLGKHWRIRRKALEDFLRQHEHSTTLVGQLSTFLRVPDNVLAIAQNIDTGWAASRGASTAVRRWKAGSVSCWWTPK